VGREKTAEFAADSALLDRSGLPAVGVLGDFPKSALKKARFD
jgi:hypothetical protein